MKRGESRQQRQNITQNVKRESVSFIAGQFFSWINKVVHKDDQNCALWMVYQSHVTHRIHTNEQFAFINLT